MTGWLRRYEPGLIVAGAAAASAAGVLAQVVGHAHWTQSEQIAWMLVPVLWALFCRRLMLANRRLRDRPRELGERIGHIAGTHTGIRLRVAVPEGVILEGDSDWLYLVAQMHNLDAGQQPDLFSSEQPWHQVLTTNFGLTLWIQPVQLADVYADDSND